MADAGPAAVLTPRRTPARRRDRWSLTGNVIQFTSGGRIPCVSYIHQVEFTHGERTYRCHVAPVGIFPAHAMWMVEVDGMWRSAFRSAADETEEDVKRRVIEWDQLAVRQTGRPADRVNPRLAL